MNGRGMRKWIGTAGSPGTGSRKSYQTSGNKHLFKYINIYNRVYQRYTGPKKEREQGETWIKHGCGKFKKRNTGTEDYWSRRELSRMQKKRTKAEMQKREMKEWYIRTSRKNEEKYAEYRYKRKKSLHTAGFMKIS